MRTAASSVSISLLLFRIEDMSSCRSNKRMCGQRWRTVLKWFQRKKRARSRHEPLLSVQPSLRCCASEPLDSSETRCGRTRHRHIAALFKVQFQFFGFVGFAEAAVVIHTGMMKGEEGDEPATVSTTALVSNGEKTTHGSPGLRSGWMHCLHSLDDKYSDWRFSFLFISNTTLGGEGWRDEIRFI